MLRNSAGIAIIIRILTRICRACFRNSNMTPLSDLHQLIHATSTPERRYFRMWGNMQTSASEWNYLQLFDAILKQKDYDEAAIKQQFAGTKIAKNLAVEKHYLYMQLLKCLRQYRTRNRKDLQLREMIDAVEILAEKGMAEAAWRLLQRASKLAVKLDLPLVRMEIHILERRMGKQILKKKKANSSGEGGKEILGVVENEMDYHLLYDRFSMMLGQNHSARKAESEAELKEMLAHPLMSKIELAQSFYARTLFLQMKASAAFLRGDFEASLDYYGENLAEWRRYPNAIQRFPRRFLRVLGNYMTGLQKADRFSEIPAVLEEMRKCKKKYGILDTHNDTREYHFELLYYANIGKFEEAHIAADRMQKFFLQFEDKLHMKWKLPSAFNLAAVFFILGEFKKALRWINYIIQVEPTDKRKQIQHSSRIFQLVVHYELENLELLEYLIRNSKAYLRRHASMDRFELAVLNTMRDLMRAVTKKDRQRACQQLFSVLDSGFKKQIVGLDEIKAWARARSEGQKMTDVLPT